MYRQQQLGLRSVGYKGHGQLGLVVQHRIETRLQPIYLCYNADKRSLLCP